MKAINISIYYTICGASVFDIIIKDNEESNLPLSSLFNRFVQFFDDLKNDEDSLEDLLINLDFSMNSYGLEMNLDPNLLWHGFEYVEEILREDIENARLAITIHQQEGPMILIFADEEGSIDRFIDCINTP